MDGEALAALELPAILERLAAAAATELGAALARALSSVRGSRRGRRRQALTAEAVELLDERGRPAARGRHRHRVARRACGARRRAAARRAARGVGLGARRGRRTPRRAGTPRRGAAARRDRGARSSRRCVELAEAIDRCVEEDGSDLRDDASPTLRKLRARGAERRRAPARRARADRAVGRTCATRCRSRSSPSGADGRCSRCARRRATRSRASSTTRRAPGRRVFVEPLAVVELGNRLAEAAARGARGGGAHPARALGGRRRPRRGARRARRSAVAELDLAFARGALSRGWRGAEVQVADEVRLVGARHPLLDRATAVPIDLDLGELRALVISGPNTGGKTVALKTLGLAALLHQCGLRPPAAEAALPVFDERARRHRRPAVDRDEPLDVLRARAHARRDPRVGDRTARSCCSTRSRPAPIRRRARRSRRRSSSGLRGRRG